MMKPGRSAPSATICRAVSNTSSGVADATNCGDMLRRTERPCSRQRDDHAGQSAVKSHSRLLAPVSSRASMMRVVLPPMMSGTSRTPSCWKCSTIDRVHGRTYSRYIFGDSNSGEACESNRITSAPASM